MARCVEFDEHEKIEKAMNVFWEKGYNGTSMQDLVDAMQINRSSLYNTIGDKHQLFIKCINNYADTAICEAKQKIAQETSSLQALINMIRDKAAWIVDCEKGCLGMKTIFEIAPEDVEVRKLLSKTNQMFTDLLAGVIQKAINDGEMSAAEDARLMAEYISMSFTGWKQSYILNRDPIQIKKMSEYLIKTITK